MMFSMVVRQQMILAYCADIRNLYLFFFSLFEFQIYTQRTNYNANMSGILQKTQDEQPPVLQRDCKDSFELLCAGFVRHYLPNIRFIDISSIVSSYLLLYNMNVESIVVKCSYILGCFECCNLKLNLC